MFLAEVVVLVATLKRELLVRLQAEQTMRSYFHLEIVVPGGTLSRGKFASPIPARATPIILGAGVVLVAILSRVGFAFLIESLAMVSRNNHTS